MMSTKKIIGVDARPLNYERTGIGRYTEELLKLMVNSEHEWHLYGITQNKDIFSSLPNVHQHLIPSKNRLLRAVIAYFVFPYWIKMHDIEIFWSPRHQLPFMLPKKVVTILTIHDLVWKKFPLTMTMLGRLQERFITPRSAKVADMVVTVSHSSSMDIQSEIGIGVEKIRVVSPGTSNLFESSIKKIILHGVSQPYILFVGTLEPRKNLQKLLKAFSLLTASERNNTHLIIVGAYGWGGDNLAKLVERYQLSEYVFSISNVDDSDLLSLYDNALFLAMPSIYEGFGIPIVEAMSRGLPILTSNNSSMPEVAGQAGHFVDPFSVESIYDGLKKMINDSEYRNRLASQAKLKAKTYDWEISAKSFLGIIDEISAV